ncbi:MULTISPECIES: dihydroneopterin aldolase [Priestia]|uniref:dihydroneopterin aldolase n=1 Tax=Priestia TaxID=2800373 RepID=UPI0005C55C32|nr:dihydroneopterin aldolase [Priestia megaterium]MEB2268335.1 dihydroneopterin aldolase [Priestia megaterium]
MDKIHVNDMRFYGYHGVFPEENKLGQRFHVDLAVELDLKQAGTTDNLEYSVSYADLYQTCQEVVEKRTFKLVETVAETIASELLANYELVQACTVKVYKPDPPIPGYYQSVAIEIKRSR